MSFKAPIENIFIIVQKRKLSKGNKYFFKRGVFLYTSICLKDFKGFKKGEIFNTYERANYAYLNKENSYNKEFVQVYFSDFKNYFHKVNEYLLIPKLIKEKRYKWFRKVQYTKIVTEFYKFDLETKYLRRIQREIYMPIYLIKEEEFILQFSDTIHYVVNTLEEIAKMHTFTNVDLDAEITRAAEYFKELLLLYNSTDKSAQIEVTNLLGEHHQYMDRVVRVMKEFNRV